MTQKAVAYQTNTDRMIKLNNDTRDLYALQRQTGSIKTFSTNSAGGDSISPAGPSAGNFLPIAGGTMIGAIGFNPALVAVDDGHINISRSTPQEADFSTYILVTGQGSPDDLMWIDGAAFNGQYLILQGTEEQILNILHADDPGTDGNIVTSDGQTVVMDNTIANNAVVIVTLVFDVTVSGLGAWRVVAVSSGGGGGITGNIDLKCEFGLINTKFINFCTPLQYIRSFDNELVIAVDDVDQSLILQTQGLPKITIKNNTITMNADLIMKTWDIKEVDRLLFKFDSGGALGSNTPQIYVSRPGGDTKDHLTYNSSLGSHIWTNQNLVSMQLDHTTLIKQTEQLGGNVFDMFALYQPAPETIISVTDVSALRTGLQKTQFTRIATLVNNTFENNYSGSLIFQCYRTSPNPTTFFKLNENNDDKIRMFKEVDMFVHDISRVDRLRFGTGGSEGPVNDFDNTIYGDNLFNQNYNTAQNAHYFWSFNNRVAMSFGHDDAMNNVLVVRGDEIHLPRKPIISLEDIHENSVVGQAIGQYNWTGTKEGGGFGLVQYADILVRYENRSQNDYSSSIQFGNYRGGSPIVWMDYNLNDHGYISTHAHIHLNAKDLLFQVDVATGANAVGFKNAGITVIGLSLGSEVFRFSPNQWRFASNMTIDLKNAVVDIDEFPGLPDIPIQGTRRMFVNGANDELSVRRVDGKVISLEQGASAGGEGDNQLVVKCRSFVDTRGTTPGSGFWLNNQDEVLNQVGDLVMFTNAKIPSDNGPWEVTNVLFTGLIMTLARPIGWKDGDIITSGIQITVDKGLQGQGAIFVLDNDTNNLVAGTSPLVFRTIWRRSYWYQAGNATFDQEDIEWIKYRPNWADNETRNTHISLDFISKWEGVSGQDNGGWAKLLQTEQVFKVITATTRTGSPSIFKYTITQKDLDEAITNRPSGVWLKDGGPDIGYTFYFSISGANVGNSSGFIQIRQNDRIIETSPDPTAPFEPDEEFPNMFIGSSSTGFHWEATAFTNDQDSAGGFGQMQAPPLRAGDVIEVWAWKTIGASITLRDIAFWLVPQAFTWEGMVVSQDNTGDGFRSALPPTSQFEDYVRDPSFSVQIKANGIFANDYLQVFRFNGEGFKGLWAWPEWFEDGGAGPTESFMTPTFFSAGALMVGY